MKLKDGFYDNKKHFVHIFYAASKFMFFISASRPIAVSLNVSLKKALKAVCSRDRQRYSRIGDARVALALPMLY